MLKSLKVRSPREHGITLNLSPLEKVNLLLISHKIIPFKESIKRRAIRNSANLTNLRKSILISY
jgi:hypothetical protein